MEKIKLISYLDLEIELEKQKFLSTRSLYPIITIIHKNTMQL